MSGFYGGVSRSFGLSLPTAAMFATNTAPPATASSLAPATSPLNNSSSISTVGQSVMVEAATNPFSAGFNDPAGPMASSSPFDVLPTPVWIGIGLVGVGMIVWGIKKMKKPKLAGYRRKSRRSRR